MGKSKKYQGKLCVYCRKNFSTTADHVFPREMFQSHHRNMLPKVPACADCNNEKSKLEHYLLSTLPFGGTNADAHEALSVDVRRRLGKNHKLLDELKKGFRYKSFFIGNNIENRLVVNFNSNILHNFVGLVIRGLVWHHWKRYLPLGTLIEVFTPSQLGIELLDNLFHLSTKCRINICLGGDTVRYKGVMSEEDESVTIWAVQLLGGITVSDDESSFIFRNSFVAVLTGPAEILEELQLE